MVKHPAHRLRKYEAGVDPDKIRANLQAHKDTMIEQQQSYFGEISDVEDKAKRIVEEAGVTTYEVAQYVNVARKCYSLAKRFKGQTLIDEAQWVVNHWASRGMVPLLLARVCNISGCGVSAPTPGDIPTACTLGNLLVCGPDGWQELVPGPSCTALHSQGPGVIPNWQAMITDHGALAGLLDDDHTQYVLRSILTTHGDIFYRDGAGIQRLAPGVAGRVLSTQGVGAPPQWIVAPGGDPRVPRTLWDHAHIDGDSSFPAGGLATQGDMTILLPHNWNGVDAIIIWLLPGEGWANVPFDITIDAGTCVEDPAGHTQTVLGTLISSNDDRYVCWDVTAICAVVIALMNPSDLIRISVSEQWGVQGYVIGVEIQET